MRIRAGIMVIVLAASLAACGDSKPDGNNASDRLSTPSAPLTDVTNIKCGDYSDLASKIVAAQTKIFTPNNEAEATAAVDSLKELLNGLKDGAPEDVKAALDDLSAAYDHVIEAIKNPTSQAQADLASLGAKLSEDGQKITAYIASKCAGH